MPGPAGAQPAGQDQVTEKQALRATPHQGAVDVEDGGRNPTHAAHNLRTRAGLARAGVEIEAAVQEHRDAPGQAKSHRQPDQAAV